MRKNGKMIGPKEVLAAEALGCREAPVWIQENGVENIIVENVRENSSEDSSSVVSFSRIIKPL